MKKYQELQIKNVMLLFFPMAGLSNYIASNFVFSAGKAIFTPYLLFLVILLSNGKRKAKTVAWPFLPILLIAMFCVGYFRTYLFSSSLVGLPTAVIICINYVSIFLVAKLAAENFNLIRVERVMLSSFHLFFLLNVLLFALGFENEGVKRGFMGEMETVFSFTKTRYFLPLGVGMMDSSMISLIAGVGALLLYQDIQKSTPTRSLLQVYYVVIMLISVIMLVLSGGRTSLAILPIVYTLTLFTAEKNKSCFFLIGSLLFLFPIFYLPLVPPLYLSGKLEFLEPLSRTGDISEVILLNNRVLIWSSVLNYLYENLQPFKLLFGYGVYGQTVSGVVDTYNFLFSSSYASTEAINLHGSFMQVLMNYGLLGILLYYLIIFKSLKFFLSDSKHKIMLYLLLTIILATMLEAQLAIDTYLFIFFIFLITYAFSLKNETITQKPLVTR
jgi:hypothetical protein